MSIRSSEKPAKSENEASLDRPLVDISLYKRSGAEIYGIQGEQFEEILNEVERKASAANANSAVHERSAFRAALRVEELALARGCAAGNEKAWQDFISRYRQKLHNVALHITHDATHAGELADSLFAELYGVSLRDGVRNSKLSSYTGRGSLEGWLRTVMAQEFVNRYRKQKRTVSLEEQTEDGVQFAAAPSEPATGTDVDERLEGATDQALAELSSEDRFTLAAYFLDGRTLAEIARMLGLHESSVSRRLDRLATGIRKRILVILREKGMSHAQATEALETDVRDIQLNLRARLAQDSNGKAFFRDRASAADAIRPENPE